MDLASLTVIRGRNRRRGYRCASGTGSSTQCGTIICARSYSPVFVPPSRRAPINVGHCRRGGRSKPRLTPEVRRERLGCSNAGRRPRPVNLDPLFRSGDPAMKIEYLNADQPPLPLVRLFDFQPEEAMALRDACNDLANGRKPEFGVHEQPWVEPINGCCLFWRASNKDVGVRVPPPHQPLVLEYSAEAWREVEGKLEYFTAPGLATFNWLTMEGDVQVLISWDGKW